MIDYLKRYIDPLRKRVSYMIGRCIIQAVSETTLNIQGAQITIFAGEVQDGVERLQNYGFTSNPKPGAEGVVVYPGGDRSMGLIIAVDDRRYRLTTLASGEVALYTDEGDYIWFKRNRKLYVRSNKFQFQGQTEELMNLIHQLAQQVDSIANTLSTDTTNTVFGPMQLNAFATYATIKTSVDTIISKLEGITV